MKYFFIDQICWITKQFQTIQGDSGPFFIANITEPPGSNPAGLNPVWLIIRLQTSTPTQERFLTQVWPCHPNPWPQGTPNSKI